MSSGISQKWQQMPQAQKIMFVFAIVMVFAFIGLAGYLLLSDDFAYIPQNVRIIFGCLLIAYGLFRLVRVYTQLNTGRRNFEND